MSEEAVDTHHVRLDVPIVPHKNSLPNATLKLWCKSNTRKTSAMPAKSSMFNDLVRSVTDATVEKQSDNSTALSSANMPVTNLASLVKTMRKLHQVRPSVRQTTKEDDLRTGDLIALYAEESRGFVYASQSLDAHNFLAIGRRQDVRTPDVSQMHLISFQICAQNRYKATKKYGKLIREYKKYEGDLNMNQIRYLQAAKQSADYEASENSSEQDRQRGRLVYYGQIVELRHTFTGKFVHVNATQTSLTETSNLLLELLAHGGKQAQFRIMPRYKVKSEGDVVQISDLITLESVKSLGQFLHCSSHVYTDGVIYKESHELNLSVVHAGFSIHRLTKSAEASDATIVRGGSIVQLFHREMEAYMAAEGVFGGHVSDNVHLRGRPLESAHKNHMLPPSTAIVSWCIEKQSSVMDASAIQWEEHIRLQHVTTRQYLAFSAETGVQLSPNRDDPNTVFRIWPVAKRGANVTNKSFIRLQHALSGVWLHGERQFEYTRAIDRVEREDDCENPAERLAWSHAPLYEVRGYDRLLYNDAYTVELIPPSSVADTLYMSGVVPFVQRLLYEFHISVDFAPRRILRVQSALSELKSFMYVNGVFVKLRQKLLRDFKVVDILVELLKCPPKAESTNHFYEFVHAECYAILQVYLEGNSRKNELYLAKHINFFHEQLSHMDSVGLNAAFMLMELLKDNRCIIDLVRHSHMDMFIELLVANKNYRYLDLLAVLCMSEDTSLPENQTYIAEKWLVQYPAEGKNVLNYLEKGSSIGLSPEHMYISTDMKKTWLPLIDFVQMKNGVTHEEYLFLEYQLRLFSALVKGRNTRALELIREEERLTDFDRIFACLSNEHLTDEFRAVSAANICDLYINVGANYPIMDRVKLVFDYNDIPSGDSTARAMKRTSSMLSGCAPLPFAKQLKDWISAFLSANQRMVASRNVMMTNVLSLLNSLVAFGYYGDTEDIQRLLRPMLHMIDGKNDLPYPIDEGNNAVVSGENRRAKAKFQASDRFEVNAQNSEMCGAKYEAMKVVELFFNFRFNTRLMRFIAEFKKVQEQSRSHAMAPFLEEGSEEDFRNNASLRKTAINDLHAMFKETSYFGDEFLDVCKDMLAYSHRDVVRQALVLLDLYHSANERLFNKCVDTQLLCADTSIDTFCKVANLLPALKLLLKNKLSAETVHKIVEILQKLVKMCCLDVDLREYHPINQEMLYNCGLMHDIFDLISPFASTTKTKAVHHIQLLRECFRLLRAMTRGNKFVQGYVFHTMTFLASIKGADEQLAGLYIEMFTDNVENCLKIRPRFIKTIVRLYTDSINPVWLTVLASLVINEDFPVKRNQAIVVKELMSHEKSLAVITQKDTGAKLEILFSGDDDLNNSTNTPVANTSSQFALRQQLCSLVYLFSQCAAGDNKSVESICQCLISIDELLSFVTLPSLCPGLRLPFIVFLTNGYLNNASSEISTELEKYENDPRWATLLHTIEAEITQATMMTKQSSSTVMDMLAHRPRHRHRRLQDTQHERMELLHFVFDGALPFLRALCEQHRHILPQDMMTSLRTSVTELASAIPPSLTRAQHRTQLILTMYAVGGGAIKIPHQLTHPNDNRTIMRQKYEQRFEHEIRLNAQFDRFASNLLAAYQGANTIKAQIIDRSVVCNGEAQYKTNDDGLPLGEEFQNFVALFRDAEKENEYNVVGLVKYLSVARKSAAASGISHREKLKQLDIKCLQLLRTMLHNIIIRLPPNKRDEPQQYARVERELATVQNSLCEQGVPRVVLPLLRKVNMNTQLVKECFHVLYLMYKNNASTPEMFVAQVRSRQEESFFTCVKSVVHDVADLLKEKRMLFSLHQRAVKERKHVVSATPTIAAGILCASLRDTELARDISARPEQRREEEAKKGKLILTAEANGHVKSNGFLSASHNKQTSFEMTAHGVAGGGGGGGGAMGKPMPTLVTQVKVDFLSDYSTTTLALKTISALCDLEFAAGQNIMREQVNNVKSVNVVQELCNFLAILHSNVDGETVELLTELIITIAEACQGNTNNQAVVFDSKAVDFVNHILLSEDVRRCAEDKRLNLQMQLAYMLKILTEENQTGLQTQFQSKMIMAAVNKDTLWQMVDDCYIKSLAVESTPEQRSWSLHNGFVFYHLLCRAHDLSLLAESPCNPLSWEDLPNSAVRSTAVQYFSSQSFSIELLKKDVLQRLYFRESLRDEVKDRLKWEVDRSSHGNKVRDFMGWIYDIHDDMHYQRRINSNILGRTFVRGWKALNYLVLAVTMALNMIMMIHWRFNSRRSFWVYHEEYIDFYWHGLGYLHNILSMFLIASYFLSNASGLMSSATVTKLYLVRALNTLLRRPLPPLPRSSKLQVSIIGTSTAYYLMFGVFSVLGTLLSPAFFATHLLQIVENNQLLSRVIRAVTVNGKSLLWVCLLGVVVIYMYGLVGFMAMRGVFQGNLHFCDSLWQCTLSMFREGLIYRTMRIDYPVKVHPSSVDLAESDFSDYQWKLLFDISFFVIVLTIGLNVIFGIIVDTFRQLRDAKWRIEQDIQTRCFICGRQSYEFEQKGIMFKAHCTKEHNVVAYVYFFVRLQDTPREDYHHLEMFANDMAQRENYVFFPLNRAMSLNDGEQDVSIQNDLIVIEQLQSIVRRLDDQQMSGRLQAERQRQKEWETAVRNSERANNNRRVEEDAEEIFDLPSHADVGGM